MLASPSMGYFSQVKMLFQKTNQVLDVFLVVFGLADFMSLSYGYDESFAVSGVRSDRKF